MHFDYATRFGAPRKAPAPFRSQKGNICRTSLHLLPSSCLQKRISLAHTLCWLILVSFFSLFFFKPYVSSFTSSSPLNETIVDSSIIMSSNKTFLFILVNITPNFEVTERIITFSFCDSNPVRKEIPFQFSTLPILVSKSAVGHNIEGSLKNLPWPFSPDVYYITIVRQYSSKGFNGFIHQGVMKCIFIVERTRNRTWRDQTNI